MIRRWLRRRLLERHTIKSGVRDLVDAAVRLDELGASAFIGWEPAPQLYDELNKEFQKLSEAVAILRAVGALR